MTRKHDIEARLDRALDKQIAVPRLDGRFDAAVWARIEAEESRATNPGLRNGLPTAVPMARWLTISNAIGICVVLAVALYFGLRLLSGVEVSLNVDLPMPEFSTARAVTVMTFGGYAIGLLAFAFGLAFTSVGRRIRSSFL